jgi:hypothetical protein
LENQEKGLRLITGASLNDPYTSRAPVPCLTVGFTLKGLFLYASLIVHLQHQSLEGLPQGANAGQVNWLRTGSSFAVCLEQRVAGNYAGV